MAVTRDTLRHIDTLRTHVDGQVDHTTGELARAWARLWNEMTADWRKAIQQVIDTGNTGHLTQPQLFRLTRVRAALHITQTALEELATQTNTITVNSLPALTSGMSATQLAVITSQLPDVSGLGLVRAPAPEIRAIVRRATEQVTSLTRPLADDTYQVMLAELQRGIALGVNPNVVARRMLQRTQGGFEGGLSRATRIARTEMLDAHRAAGKASDEANAGVLKGWRWMATLSPSTCPACLAMHGRMFPVSAPGPEGHVNCRCARVPVTKSWAELGLPVRRETPSVFPDARAWFEGLSRSERLRVMGPTRLRLLESGAVSWDDLVVKQRNPGWRSSWQPATLSQLRADATRSA